ncbi:MAG: cysteine desulfurase family protein [Eubacteriales bacterium]|nr:cysteine desulfurase family protein [Eubacteriales bacterium]
MFCYLDNSATTQVSQKVKEALLNSFEAGFYNPSSLYAPAVFVSKEIEKCREDIKALLNADNLYFTSGGTESNNIAIIGALQGMRDKGVVLCSQIEHPSVLNACKRAEELGFTVKTIPVDSEGVINLDKFKDLLSDNVRLICVMHVNNEVGSIQPLREISALRDSLAPNALLHVDGVQAFMRVPIDLRLLKIDSYTLSGHKIQALKGIGALAVSKRNRIKPLVYGGEQESGIRAGTENTFGIFSLQAAVKNYAMENQMRSNKLLLFDKIKEQIPTATVNGPDPTSPKACDHIINISFEPVRAETMLHALEGDKIYVGNGSACSSKRKSISHVLKAMGVSVTRAESAVRFSLSPDTTAEEVLYAAERCAIHYNILKKFVRR